MIERPLATGRPLSTQIQGNAYGGRGLDGLRKQNQQDGSKPPSPLKSPGVLGDAPYMAGSPIKGQFSPGKSSLSKKSRYAMAQGFDPENGIWSDEEDSSVERQLPPGKGLHRHAKSVTFDAAPPQINEYEMTTPDPSSIASGSREGSYDSVGDEEEESFDRGSSMERDDSFDASLEDTDKTPVVLPEDWRFMSPANANESLAAHVEDPFDGEQSSPPPTSRPSTAIDTRSSPTRTDSTPQMETVVRFLRYRGLNSRLFRVLVQTPTVVYPPQQSVRAAYSVTSLFYHAQLLFPRPKYREWGAAHCHLKIGCDS